ncbi:MULTISPECIES: IS66 family insertion sequence element accessory protein TnpB [unclassified Bradyrhizobium]|uniref:IS66 family insertion sequence element accessory protein TnpB n=1 Tax=unclassified Bradyrhizobium TaxID=2631580 RepID=UPI002FF2404C
MMIVPAGVKVHLALGSPVCLPRQESIDAEDPVLDGNGLCLFTKRIDQGRFAWPVMAGYVGSITLTLAQLAMLIEGIDWRAPERVWKPALAG